VIRANDSIVAVTNGLDLPEIYRRHEGQTHTASDGQKFEVAEESLGASYSLKYFGSKQASASISSQTSRACFGIPRASAPAIAKVAILGFLVPFFRRISDHRHRDKVQHRSLLDRSGVARMLQNGIQMKFVI
jgi:Tn3 transposase DDE domain